MTGTSRYSGGGGGAPAVEILADTVGIDFFMSTCRKEDNQWFLGIKGIKSTELILLECVVKQ